MPGRRYLVSGASFDVRTAVTLLRQATGHPRRVWFAPRALAVVGGAVVGGRRARSTRRESGRICPETVRTLLHGHRFDASLAERELGLATRRSRSRSGARSRGTPSGTSRPRR